MKRRLILLFVLAILLVLTIAPQVQASTSRQIDIEAILNRIKNLILWPIFSGLVVIIFIWAGILYLTARGEPGKIQAANKALIWGMVGVAVGILAYSAYNIVYWLIYGVVLQQ